MKVNNQEKSKLKIFCHAFSNQNIFIFYLEKRLLYLQKATQKMRFFGQFSPSFPIFHIAHGEDSPCNPLVHRDYGPFAGRPP